MAEPIDMLAKKQLPKTIILCATQRCGSTMIVEDMRNSGALGNPEEWFIGWSPEKIDVNWSKALANLRTKATGENGVAAVKVMANQLLGVEGCLKEVLKPPPGPRFFRFKKVFEQANWVRLKRRDVVAQAISRIMAQQTGINHATSSKDTDHFAGNLMKGYDKDYNAKAQYNYDAILREVTSISLENLAWDHFFRDHEITPMEFVYEDVIKDSEMKHLDLMAECVGLQEQVPRKPRTMVKVGNQLNQNFEKNFMRDAAERKFR